MRTLLYSLLTLLGLLLIWAAFGKLDVVASAEGKLLPQSYLKIVQPSEQGVIRDILVNEGERRRGGNGERKGIGTGLLQTALNKRLDKQEIRT